MVAEGVEEGWSGISRYKLLHTGQKDKVLLYSTGNYFQCPGINHNGKYKKRMYINIKLSHFAMQQKLTHRKSTILQ